MIRRTVNGEDGSTSWVLISQIEHSRLAGHLAAHWGREPFAPLEHRDCVLPAIYRHDDGWWQWEDAPMINPDTGAPRCFLEMPSDVAHAIWSRSVNLLADAGPLAQYMVAEHFCRLRRGGNDADDPAVQQFLAEMQQRCDRWLDQWQAGDPDHRTPAAARRAVDCLQLFDAFSLWLCCAPRESPLSLATPWGPQLTAAPVGERILVSPWPWTSGELQLTIDGRQIPAAPLEDDGALRAVLARAEPVRLEWKFTPAGTLAE